MATIDYPSLVNSAAKKYGVDPDLAMALGVQESGLNAASAKVVSSAGAIGPYQLVPGADGLFHRIAGDAGINPWDPSANVDAGVKYLADLQKQYGDDATALMAYNWGPGNVDNFLKNGGSIPAETLNHATSILTKVGDTAGVEKVKSYSPGGNLASSRGDTGKVKSGSPNAKIVNPGTWDVEERGTEVHRDLDADTQTLKALENPPQDIHESYFASAEVSIGGVVICPFSPELVPAVSSSINFGSGVRDVGSSLVDLETRGLDLRLEEFQYRSISQGGNSILFRLFVKSWTDVVAIIALAAQSQDITIRFGYTNIPNGLIGPLEGVIVGTQPEFLENGYTISIEALDKTAAIDAKVGSNNILWRAKSGRPSDIVWFIANKRGWKTCIEPTKKYDVNSTWHQHAQTDINFFNETIGPNVQSEVPRPEFIGTDGGQGYGPYVAYLQSDVQNGGAPILHFHPRTPAAASSMSNPSREYVWGGVVDPEKRMIGTVISFQPQFDNAAFSILGASRMDGWSIDVDKKIFHRVRANGSDVTDKLIGGRRGNVNVQMSANDVARIHSYSDQDIALLEPRIASMFFALRDYSFTANLVVQGDPFIRSGMIINVQAYRPLDGSIMFYDWFVNEAIHTITGGEYTVSMSLHRTSVGVKETDNELTALGAGMSQYFQKVTLEKRSKGYAVGTGFQE